MNALLNRKSIRKFQPTPVSEENIRTLLQAAMSAPSAANQQPWHFVVLKDRAMLDAIPKFHPYAGPLKEAPLAIAVCATEDLGAFKDYWVQDCAAATQNILTAAVELELGAVWLGVYPKQNVQDVHTLLKLPQNIVPFSLIAIGHPDEQKEAGDRYDQNRVHHNIW